MPVAVQVMPVSISARGNTEQSLPLSCHLIQRFCDEYRWNYTLPRSRCGFESRRLHHWGAVVQWQNTKIRFTTPCRRIFFRQRMPWVLHCVAGSSPAPVTGSSAGRANVPINSSLHGGLASPPFLIDPANAGGTTERKGRGFNSRQPAGCSSADRALRMFHQGLSPQ